MLFNSFVFIFIFLPLVLVGYFLLNNFGKERLAKGFLVLASLYFYAYFNYKYTYLIVLSILVNYYLGSILSENRIVRAGSSKYCFIAGLIFNVGMLFNFKYYDFFISNMNLAFKTNLPILNLMLPLGISFFTFQQLSFLIDSYKGKGAKYDFLSYCLFVTFFPQLIAGPIVLPEEMLPQFENHENKKINYENLNRGLYLFSIGLAKKVLIADSIAPFADAGFDKMTSLTFIEGWLTSISYTMQLYFDFSGYCDMAMGIALMFNIVLPLNFNSPYKSSNIQEFWKRWHMTLGRFLTNYLYIPLGGNRKGELKTLRNLLIVFLASGIWHGAGWNFIIWGALHGTAILIHRLWKNKGYRMPAFLGWAITLFSVNIFWVFFRAKDLAGAFQVLGAMINYRTLSSFITENYKLVTNPYLGNKVSLLLLVMSILIVILFKNSFEKNKNIKFCNMNCFEIAIYSVSSILLLKKSCDIFIFQFLRGENNEKEFFKTILLTGLPLILIMILNFKVDPMRFYRNPSVYTIGHWREDERILNAGIIRNSEFDSILIGSSMTRNFDIDSIDKIFNWKTIKLTMSAATQRDISYTYNFVKEVNPNFKNIILGIDIETFFQNKDFQKIEFDKSFYIKDRILNLGYLLNFRTLKYSLEFLKLNLFKTKEEIESIYKLGYKYEYKKENVLNLVKTLDLKSSSNFENEVVDNEILGNMMENYEKNLKVILENSKDKNFYLFFPPYSSHYYDNLIESRTIDEYYSFKDFLIKELGKYGNVKIYDFQDIDSIVNNFDNYGDLMHFSPEVSQQILTYMKEGMYKVN